jgi:ribosomal protein S18 acetylase RimI-like enzyme
MRETPKIKAEGAPSEWEGDGDLSCGLAVASPPDMRMVERAGRIFGATIFRPEQWGAIAEDVVRIEEDCFSGPLGKREAEMVEQRQREAFCDPDNRVAIIRQIATSGLAGYAFARCDEGDTAHVAVVGILSEFQGQKLVAPLMDVLEDELRRMGYDYAKIEAVKENGYADKVVKAYGRRIVDYSEDAIHANIKYEL